MPLSIEKTIANRQDPCLALAEVGVKRWGDGVRSIEPIKIRENAVFRVILGNGRRAVLRIHRQGYHSTAALRSEFQWAEALRESGIIAPRAILSQSGRAIEEVALRDGGAVHQIDMLEWIDGVQLGSVEAGLSGEAASIQGAYRRIGALAARIHNHGVAWLRPVGFERHSWDLEGLVGSRPLWGRFWELESLSGSERSLVEKTRDRLRRDLSEFGVQPDRFGLIHADLVPENVLADGERLAVIDFDDAGFGWHLFELATTVYFMRAEAAYPRILDAAIEGYRERRLLPDEHLSYLPVFMAARAMTYLGWLHTRKSEPAASALRPLLVDLAMSAATDYLEHSRGSL